jgi:hypothetical protein
MAARFNARSKQSRDSFGAAIQATTVAGASLVLSALPCLFLGALCVGNASAAGWLLAYDATTAPADGASQTPFLALPIPVGGWVSSQPNFAPHPCFNGCVVVFSTTGPYTQTTSVSNAQFISGQVQ